MVSGFIRVIEAQKPTFCSVVFAIARFANSPRLCNSGNFKDYDRKLLLCFNTPNTSAHMSAAWYANHLQCMVVIERVSQG